MTDHPDSRRSDPVTIGEDAEAVEQQVSDRLFTFVSIAYGLSITTVYPVVYETTREVWKAALSIPNAGLGPIRYLRLLESERFWTIATPYLDKVFLTLSLLVAWIGYFFLMAKIRSASHGRYSVLLVMLDLIQALVMFATARSLGNFTLKTSPETDTAWFGTMLMVLLAYARVLLGMLSVRFVSKVGFDVRAQYACRTLLSSAALLSATAAIVYLGLRLDALQPSVLGLQNAINSACIVGSMLVLLLLLVLGWLRVSGEEVRQDLRESWQWAWSGQQLLLAGTIVTFAVVMVVDRLVPTFAMYQPGMEMRGSIPVSIGALLMIAMCVAAGWWHNRHVARALRQSAGYQAEAQRCLWKLHDHLDRLVKGSSTLLLYEQRRGILHLVLSSGGRRGKASQAGRLAAGHVLFSREKPWLDEKDELRVFSCLEQGVDDLVSPCEIPGVDRPILAVVATIDDNRKPDGVLVFASREAAIESADPKRSHASLIRAVRLGLMSAVKGIDEARQEYRMVVRRIRGEPEPGP